MNIMHVWIGYRYITYLLKMRDKRRRERSRKEYLKEEEWNGRKRRADEYIGVVIALLFQ